MSDWNIDDMRVCVERRSFMVNGGSIDEVLAYSEVDEAAGVEPPKGTVVDMQTANVLVTVHDALSEANRAKFVEMPLLTAVDVAWRCVK